MADFSLSTGMLQDILVHAKPFGHYEETRGLNLGFGFIYYGVVRALRPKHTLVIGSGYGFSVVCLALGIKDNDMGFLSFVDPSYSLLKDGPLKTIGGRGSWSDATGVKEHFERFGISSIVSHYKMRSDEFFPQFDSLRLPEIDLAFIDGSHAFKDVRYDFIETLGRSRKNTYVFLHDTHIYVRELLRHSGVKRWLRVLKKEEHAFEIINFPFSSGVALVRILDPSVWRQEN
ncbi:MAG: class I SAM-dependent methyltransferase [Syntrophaceae bacterium]|nr:class I SAM-dependent methyltransferase [Syntrophaceae bacterium]